jgi:hypothetical protein
VAARTPCHLPTPCTRSRRQLLELKERVIAVEQRIAGLE